MKKILNAIKKQLFQETDFEKLYKEEAVNRKKAEECLTNMRAQIKSILSESNCKKYDGNGL